MPTERVVVDGGVDQDVGVERVHPGSPSLANGASGADFSHEVIGSVFGQCPSGPDTARPARGQQLAEPLGRHGNLLSAACSERIRANDDGDGLAAARDGDLFAGAYAVEDLSRAARASLTAIVVDTDPVLHRCTLLYRTGARRLRQFVHQPARSTTSWARAWAVTHAGWVTTAALAVPGDQLV